MLSATDICFRGELIIIPSAPLDALALAIPSAVCPSWTGDEWKNSGEEEELLLRRDARGVVCKPVCCADRAEESICFEFGVDRAGVADSEFLCDRREFGDDILLTFLQCDVGLVL